MSVYCLQFDCRMKDCPKHPDKAKTDREARHRDFENNVNVCIKPDFLFAQQAAEQRPLTPSGSSPFKGAKKESLPMPTESEEQQALFDWAERLTYLYPELELMYHIPNEGKRSKAYGAKLRKEGLKEGVPDIHLPVARGQYHSLYIEMKRRSDSVTSQAQRRWIRNLKRQGNAAYVCHGWEEAVKVIEEYLSLK